MLAQNIFALTWGDSLMKTHDTIDFITLKNDNDHDGEWVGELVIGKNEYPIIKTDRHGFFCAAVGAYQVSKEYLQQKLNDAVASDKTGNDFYSFVG
jgi:hypothetical protein